MGKRYGSDIVSRSQNKAKKIAWQKLLLGITLGATILGSLAVTKALATIERENADAKEAARPASVGLIKLTASNCPECYSLNNVISILKQQNLTLNEERSVAYDSLEGKKFVRQFDIKRVPTYLLTGEITKATIADFVKKNGTIKNDTFIFTSTQPLFLDPKTNTKKGKVSATYITDEACAKCVDPKKAVEAYKNAGVVISDERSVAWDSPSGQELINRYAITKVPTILFSPDISNYDAVTAVWGKIGTVEPDKTYLVRNLFLPYRDLEKGQILGLVNAIYLTDSTCNACYQPKVQQADILQRGFGVSLATERTVDVASNEGQALIARYAITAIPTVLLSPEADSYTSLQNVWADVGTVEADGWYVFRKMQSLGAIVYKDISTNEIIDFSAPAAKGTSS